MIKRGFNITQLILNNIDNDYNMLKIVFKEMQLSGGKK